MSERMRAAVLRLLRVPPEPHPPAGDPAALRVFRASPRYYRYKLALWFFGQFGAVAGILGGLFFLEMLSEEIGGGLLIALMRFGEVLAIVGFVAQLVFGLMLVRLDYELRWYMLADRSLRIREGILALREKTMTYANIQQISVRQNPLQRLLGLADIQVRSAGGGSKGAESGKREAMHEAYFRGVGDAESIRNALRERVRQHRDAGLGDPDDAGHHAVAALPASAGRAPALDAARRVLDEARALRRQLAG